MNRTRKYPLLMGIILALLYFLVVILDTYIEKSLPLPNLSDKFDVLGYYFRSFFILFGMLSILLLFIFASVSDS